MFTKQQKRWAYGCGDIAYFIFWTFIKIERFLSTKNFSLGFSVFERTLVLGLQIQL